MQVRQKSTQEVVCPAALLLIIFTYMYDLSNNNSNLESRRGEETASLRVRRAPMIWDNLAIFRTNNCSTLTTDIRADTRTSRLTWSTTKDKAITVL